MSNNDFSKMRDGAFQLFTDNEEYDNFVAKFKPKKTSDDTFTPDDVYDAVASWVRQRFGISEQVEFIRPFYPGGDYINDYIARKEEYAAGMVVDNPPFSILAKIVDFYRSQRVRFFLFCPYLTCLSYLNRRPDVSICEPGATITYGNGAEVNTAFVHNLDPSVILENAPDLLEAIANCPSQRKKDVQRIVKLPRNVFRQSSVGKLLYTKVSINRDEAIFVRSVGGYDIFGGGLMVSDAVVERVERADRADRAEVVNLTPAEQRLLEQLNARQK